MSFISTAHAMGTGMGQPAAGGGDIFASLMPFLLIFAVFYFLLIRPQQKKAKEHKKMLEALKKGDAVITAGGMFGRILEVRDDIMVVDLGETKVTMGRQYLSAAPAQKQAAPPLKKENKKGRKGQSKEEPVAEPVVEEVAPDSPSEPVIEAVAEEPVIDAADAPGDVAAQPEDTPAASGDDKDKPAAQ